MEPIRNEQVGGFDGVPAAGEVFTVVGREDTARDLAEARRKIARESEAAVLQVLLLLLLWVFRVLSIRGTLCGRYVGGCRLVFSRTSFVVNHET